MKKFSVFSLIVAFILVGGFASPVQLVHAAASNLATNTEVSPGTQFTTFVGVPVYRLHVVNSGDASDAITSLSPTPSGSVVDTTVTLHFFHDVNDNGIVDQGDVDIGADEAFNADNTFHIFDITDVTVPVAGSASILITADIAAGVGAEIFNLSFAAGADILMTVEPSGTFPMLNDAALTVSLAAPAVTIDDGAADPAAKTVKASATNVAVKQLSVTAAAGSSDSLVSLAPTPAGTENDNTNITSVVFYIDSGSVPGQVDGTDVQLVTSPPATYTANDTKTTFTFSSPVQIVAGTSFNILVVYNLGAGVTNGNTLTAIIAAAGDVVAGSGTVVTQSSIISSTITIDTVASTVVITAPAPSATVRAATVFTFTSSEPGTQECSINAGAFEICASGDAFSTLSAFAALGEVAFTLNVRDTDAAGNVGSDAETYTKDTLAPVLTSIILDDSALNIGDTALVTFTFTESVAGTFTNADITTINNGTLSAVADGGLGTVWTATFTPTAGVQLDTSNVITVTMTGITDLAANPGVGTVSSANYDVDTLAPTVVITVSQPLINIADDGGSFQVIATFNESMDTNTVDEPGFSVDIVGANDGTHLLGQFFGSWSVGDTVFTRNYVIHGNIATEDPDVDVTVSGGQDLAGNLMSPTTTNDLFDVDTIAPTVTIDAAEDINLANVGAYTLTGTCSENTQTVTVGFGGAVTSTPVCTLLAWTTGPVDVSAAADSATFAITADHTDAAGNPAVQATDTVAKDTLASTVVITAPAPSATVRAATVFTFTSSEPGTQECSINAGAFETCVSGDAFSTLADFGALGQVGFTLNVRDTDGAGNVGSDAEDYVKDTLASTVVITAPAPSATVRAATVFTFTSTEPGTQQCNIDGGAWESCTSGDAFSTLSDFADLTEVAFTLNVRDTDAVGNVGTDAETYTKDTLASTVVITAPAPSATVRAATVFTFTSTEPGTQECNIDGGAWESCTSGDAFSTLSDFGGLGEVGFTLNVRDTDGAGNVGTDAEDYTKDTIAPSTPTASPVANTYSGTQTVTLSSAGSTSIRYATDGSTPTCSVGLTTSPISVASSVTIRAIGCDDAGNGSSALFSYTILNVGDGGGGVGAGGGGGYVYIPTPTPTPTPTSTPTSTPATVPSPTPAPVVNPALLQNLQTMGIAIHDLVKLPNDGNANTQGDSTVYYVGADGKRHAFPNTDIFFSWYTNFNGVRVITVQQLASIPLGINVRYKPGRRMVKFATDPKVYVVSRGGVLRWVKSEAIAIDLYGILWNTKIGDLNDVLYGNYTIGADVNNASDFNVSLQESSVGTISTDFGL